MRPSQPAKMCMCDMPDLNIAVTIMLFQSFNSMLKKKNPTNSTSGIQYNPQPIQHNSHDL